MTDLAKRQLSPGSRTTLKLIFQNRYTGDKASDYSLKIDFAEGCSLEI